MKLRKGIHDYDIESGQIIDIHIILHGSFDNRTAEPFKMAEVTSENMSLRYTPENEMYNPQDGVPMYWSRFANTLTVWPIPDQDYELVIRMDEGVQKVEVEQRVVRTV